MFALLPFEAERSIVKWDKKKGKKQERLQKIAKEAAEQAHRTHIPTVFEPISFKQLVQQIDHFDAVLLLMKRMQKLKSAQGLRRS